MNILQSLGSMLGGSKGGSGSIQVTVVQARKLARKDVLSKSDPYCLLSVARKYDVPLQNHIGTHYKTTVMNNNQDPYWNQTFNLSVKDSESELLRIKVYDYDHATFDDLIGEVDIPLFSLRNGVPKDEWYQLSPAKGGAVRLIITANGFGMTGNMNMQGMNQNMMQGNMNQMGNMGNMGGMGMGQMQQPMMQQPMMQPIVQPYAQPMMQPVQPIVYQPGVVMPPYGYPAGILLCLDFRFR